MKQDLLRRYARPVPRYTSYPTAPQFSSTISAPEYRRWLGEIPSHSTLSLYVHIPFCDTLCWFCGCNTKITQRYQPIAAYTRILEREVQAVAGLAAAEKKVTHIHWGGGSPTILHPDDILRVAQTVRDAFNISEDAEFAVEIDPRGLSGEHIETLAAARLTRASIGVQDFDPRVQKAINRIQSYSETHRVVDALRQHGVASINLDLMYGLPHQSCDTIAATIEQSLRLQPDRMALFGYAHVPWMKRHMKMIPQDALPDITERFAQAQFASDMLQQSGYVRIGLDHFAKPEDALAQAAQTRSLRRNFQGYTNDPADALIGFGASSIGQLPQGYVQNETATAHYMRKIMAGDLATAKGLAFSPEDRVRSYIIERIMCDMALDWDAVEAAQRVSRTDFLPDDGTLQQFAEDELLELNTDGLKVTEAGRPFLRSIAAAFDAYLTTSAAKHSVAV